MGHTILFQFYLQYFQLKKNQFQLHIKWSQKKEKKNGLKKRKKKKEKRVFQTGSLRYVYYKVE